jgi:hypothetical protein
VTGKKHTAKCIRVSPIPEVRLIEVAAGGHDSVLATLGRLPSGMVRPALAASSVLQKVAPLLLLSERANWLAPGTA